MAVRRRGLVPGLPAARARRRNREGLPRMTTLASTAPPRAHVSGPIGPLGRLGGWTAAHVRAVSIAWLLVALALAAFAPKVETALSGAGWQANGSESVQARALIQ